MFTDNLINKYVNILCNCGDILLSNLADTTLKWKHDPGFVKVVDIAGLRH